MVEVRKSKSKFSGFHGGITDRMVFQVFISRCVMCLFQRF